MSPSMTSPDPDTSLCLTSLADLLWYSMQGLHPTLPCLILPLYLCLYPTTGGQGEGGPGSGLQVPAEQGDEAPVIYIVVK